MNPRKEFHRFAVLRHAQTHWNVAKRIQGRQNSDLTEYGRKQAADYAGIIEPLGVSAILHSDLGRARETAEIINARLNLPLFEDKGLREQDWGLWEGKTLPAIRKEEGEHLELQVAKGWDFRPPQGESRRVVFERGCNALKTWASRCTHTNTLIISHAGMIKCLIYGLAGRRFLPSERPIMKPDYLHWIAWDGEKLLLEKINACKMNPEATLP